MELFNEDCLNILPQLEDNSVDLFFTDLPYGQTACDWDSKIDLNQLWVQLNRICKINCPMIFTTTTKYGLELINSNPKNFRYDLVWIKSAPTGFLNAKKMPMRKHEMIYVFYRKLPFYNIDDNHKHKYLNSKNGMKGQDNLIYGSVVKQVRNKQYDPPLPTSIIKEDDKKIYGCNNEYTYVNPKRNESIYDPPLPTSIIKEEIYGKDYLKNKVDFSNGSKPYYEPPLPNSILEIKSEKGKHQTQKPTELMEWFLKYYSKEGDVVLDCCMGSGSMGVACKKLNRKFIGIELDKDIFKNAEERLVENIV